MDAKGVLQALISQLVDLAVSSGPGDRRGLLFAREAGQFNMITRVAMLAYPDWDQDKAAAHVTEQASELFHGRKAAAAEAGSSDEIYDRIVRVIGRDGTDASELHTLVHQLFDCVESGAGLPKPWRNTF